MNARLAIAFMLGGLALATAAPVGADPVVGAQVRYGSFSNGNDLRDGILYWAPGPFHVQLEQWDFVRGQDQFRPELGLHLRDARRSVYTLQWRHERTDERGWIGTEQVLGKRWVARGELSPLFFRDSTTVVWDLGTDIYYGSYGFAGATLVHDPREGGLWIVPVRVRFASERNDWLQLTVAPASRRSLGWAVDARVRGLRLGLERNSRFDFTALDNTIVTAGVEIPLPGRR